MTFGPLVTTDWLGLNNGAANVKVIDGSWRLPGEGNAVDAYNAQHIPGAVFFDIDAIADKSTGLPHMLPAPEQFEEAVGALGISRDDIVIVYDEKGIFSAARVWWTFRAMGHKKVAVLDGGLPKWLREGRRVASAPSTPEPATPEPATYEAKPVPAACASADDVRAALSAGVSVADARSPERYAGTAPELRPGLRSGHMPGAKNVPYGDLLNSDGTLVSPDALRQIFAAAGIDPQNRVITSCGSGVSAAVLSLALDVIGASDHALYDGSWTEWGKEAHDNDLFPVVAGADER